MHRSMRQRRPASRPRYRCNTGAGWSPAGAAVTCSRMKLAATINQQPDTQPAEMPHPTRSSASSCRASVHRLPPASARSRPGYMHRDGDRSDHRIRHGPFTHSLAFAYHILSRACGLTYAVFRLLIFGVGMTGADRGVSARWPSLHASAWPRVRSVDGKLLAMCAAFQRNPAPTSCATSAPTALTFVFAGVGPDSYGLKVEALTEVFGASNGVGFAILEPTGIPVARHAENLVPRCSSSRWVLIERGLARLESRFFTRGARRSRSHPDPSVAARPERHSHAAVLCRHAIVGAWQLAVLVGNQVPSLSEASASSGSEAAHRRTVDKLYNGHLA